MRIYRKGDLIPLVTAQRIRMDDEEADGEKVEDKEVDGKKVDSKEIVVNRPTYDRLLEDQKYMIESGLNTTYLAQAIAAFPNLETIAVDDAFKP